MMPLARHRSADRHRLTNPTYKPFYICRHFRYQKAFFCRLPIFRQGGAWSVDKVKAKKRKFFQNYLENRGIQFFSWSKSVNRPGPASFPLIGQRKRSKRNSLCDLWKLGVTDLQKIKGIGHMRAVKITAVFALARRRNESEVIFKEKITQSRHAFEIFKSMMGDLPYEEFWILLLNRSNRLLKKVRISEGGVSGTVVDPKKVFKLCLDNQACSIIPGHNHPSGNNQPSEKYF